MQYAAIFIGCKNDNFHLIFFIIFLFLLKKLIVDTRYMVGYLSKKSIHINESFVHAIALALW